MQIKELVSKFEKYQNKEIELKGWVRFIRESKTIMFVVISDGSCFEQVQLVFKPSIKNFDKLKELSISAALRIKGTVVVTKDAMQSFEIAVNDFEILCASRPEYPLQNKEHGVEFLRENAHLRARTRTFMAIFKIRSIAAKAVHDFFEKENYVYVHAPIITSNDAEGAGESFTVTTLENNKYENDFFKRKVGLTVSAQLNAEALALAFGSVYSFGPTFRAEKSDTNRHAAEFWMVEPEKAFATYGDMMDNAEGLVKFAAKAVLKSCLAEIDYLSEKFETDLRGLYASLINNTYARVEYKTALKDLKKAKDSGHKFENDSSFEFGTDLATEHEKYLSTEIYKKPVFVVDYPKDIKAFYMKQNDDGTTVKAFDLLVFHIGELVGGSQRESSADKIKAAMKEKSIPLEGLEWYVEDLRWYGNGGSAGYGLGFERLVMLLAGVNNIRDVMAFPRTLGSIKF